MKKLILLPIVLLFYVFGFSQKLYDRKNDIYSEIKPNVHYIEVYYGSKKAVNGKDYNWKINFGEKEHLFLANEEKIDNAVAICNYLHEFGWALVTTTTNVSGTVLESMGSTSSYVTYIFRRRG